MQCDNRAELCLGIAREQRLERPFWPKARALSGNLLHFRNKLRIKRQARLSQRHHHNHSGAFRRRRKNPRTGPGCFLPRLLRSEEHTSELQSHSDLVCRLLLEKNKKKKRNNKLTTLIKNK